MDRNKNEEVFIQLDSLVTNTKQKKQIKKVRIITSHKCYHALCHQKYI